MQRAIAEDNVEKQCLNHIFMVARTCSVQCYQLSIKHSRAQNCIIMHIFYAAIRIPAKSGDFLIAVLKVSLKTATPS